MLAAGRAFLAVLARARRARVRERPLGDGPQARHLGEERVPRPVIRLMLFRFHGSTFIILQTY